MPAHSTTIGGAAFCSELKPPAISFYRAEAIESKTRPNAKGWVLANCPLHKSKSGRSFSFNVSSGAFHCFGCDARGGDVVDFVKLRYHVDFKTAAKRVGAWRDSCLSEHERRELDRQTEIRKQERELVLQSQEAERAKRLALRDEIHQDTRLMKDISVQLHQDVENETLWECLEITWECRELTEREYLKASGLEVDF
jgi:hypothetical protein